MICVPVQGCVFLFFDSYILKNTNITQNDRISKYSGCSEECFILSLIYIDRLINQNQNLIVNSLCVHRLIITSLMLAAKFFDDQYFNNAYYGKVGGVNGKGIVCLYNLFRL